MSFPKSSAGAFLSLFCFLLAAAIGVAQSAPGPFRVDNKMGFRDASGQVTIPPKYDHVQFDTEADIYLVRLDGKWGFVSKAGQEVTAPTYDSVLRFINGSFPVRRDGRSGIVDQSGREIIPCLYDAIFTTANRREFLAMLDGRPIRLDPTGRVMQTPGGGSSNAPPPATAAPRPPQYVQLPHRPLDLRRHLPGDWQVRLEFPSRNPTVFEGRFTRDLDALLENPNSSRPIRHPARIHEQRIGGISTFRVHVQINQLRLEGWFTPRRDDGSLTGNVYDANNRLVANWSATKHLDREYAALAAEALRSRQRSAALHYYGEALRLQPRAEYYEGRGQVHFDAEDFESAISDYDQALRREPQRAVALFNRMAAHFNLRTYGAALADSDRLITPQLLRQLNTPTQAMVHQIRGDCLWWLDRREEAEQAYAQAVRLDPSVASITRAADTRQGRLAEIARREQAIARIHQDLADQISETSEQLRESLGRAGVPPNELPPVEEP